MPIIPVPEYKSKKTVSLVMPANFESKIEKIANLTDSIVGLKSEDLGLLNLNPLNRPPDILIFII